MSNKKSTIDCNNPKELLDDFINNVIKKENAPYNFNILDEQCGHIVENSHTNILMRLLQYKSPQYGYVFLENFFKYLGISIKIKQGDVIFKREKFIKGKNKDGRIDGFIYQETNFALIIENKINHACPTDLQIENYIYAITNNKSESHIESDKIWVLYLTLDGSDKPQNTDVIYMRKLGICSNNSENDDIQGDRYFAINYQDDILPWLKDEIQPIVMQRDQTLNTGLLQYIDYLEGMFGKRQQDIELLRKSEEWKSKLITKLKLSENFEERNKLLSKIIINLKNIQEGLEKDTEDSKREHYAAGILINLLQGINDEPMKEFFDITRKYFEDNKLMKKCVISHPFSFSYIQIRDESWLRSIHFEWTSIGEKLSQPGSRKNIKYNLYFHMENKEEKAQECFKDIIKWDHSIDAKTPILKMERNDLEKLLIDAYSKIPIDLIQKVNEYMKKES